MKKYRAVSLAVVIFSASLSVLAQDENQWVPATALNSSSIESDFERNTSLLKVSYSTGGCSRDQHGTAFDLKLDTIKDVTPPRSKVSEYEVIVDVVITQKRAGDCAKAYDVAAEVDLRTLAMDNAARMGINLNAVKVSYDFVFRTPPVEGFISFLKWD